MEDSTGRGIILRTLITPNGDVKIGQHADDWFINLTQLCQAAGKEFGGWRRLQQAQEYLEALSSDMQICMTELIQIVRGGTPYEQGSWGHPMVAMELARWLDPSFAVQVNKWFLMGERPGKKATTPFGMIKEQLAALMEIAEEMHAMEERTLMLEASQEDQSKRLERIEAELAPPGYMTAMGFCRSRRINEPDAPQRLGYKSTMYCKRYDITYFELSDIRWGKVNAYEIHILELVAKQEGFLP